MKGIPEAVRITESAIALPKVRRGEVLIMHVDDFARLIHRPRARRDMWEGRIGRWLARLAPGDADKNCPPRLRGGVRMSYTTTDEVLEWCIGMESGKHGRTEQMRVAAIMKRLGWKQDRPRVDGVKERRWVRASGEKGEGGGDDPPF